MSLDVTLTVPGLRMVRTGTGYFVRENGATVEKDGPGIEGKEYITNEVFSRNITHNLAPMAKDAGLYKALWCAEDCGVRHAGQLIPMLKYGLERLKKFPDRFKALNPSNGWGNYEGLVAFVEAYLAACEEYPRAEVSVSR